MYWSGGSPPPCIGKRPICFRFFLLKASHTCSRLFHGLYTTCSQPAYDDCDMFLASLFDAPNCNICSLFFSIYSKAVVNLFSRSVSSFKLFFKDLYFLLDSFFFILIIFKSFFNSCQFGCINSNSFCKAQSQSSPSSIKFD